jgi:plastocyanin
MRPILRLSAGLAVALLVAACGGTGATTTPTSPGGTSAPATAATDTSAPVATQAAALCTDVTQAAPATDVSATVANFTWAPVSAKVGQVITWTNNDTAAHGVKTDQAGCKMNGSIQPGQTRSLVFNQAGTFTFVCFVHPSMKGTITISQ